MMPRNPADLLPRKQTADALKDAGFPVSPATLATMATRGGGPPYRLFGQRALYRWGDALEWAKARMTVPRRSTAEADAPSRSLNREDALIDVIEGVCSVQRRARNE